MRSSCTPNVATPSILAAALARGARFLNAEPFISQAPSGNPRCRGPGFFAMHDHRNHVNPMRLIGSVVIPAHDEAGVIRRCLDSLFTGFKPGELNVVVVCNGCRDDTAMLARASGHPVRVIELVRASKAAALRAGDAVALAFPRLY